MKKLAACLLVIGIMFTGCTGSFKMTKAVYKFHRSQTKVMDEVIFLGCVILPVYGLATLADGIILNSIEFWTGHNPMAAKAATENTIVQKGQDKALLKFDAASGDVTVCPVDQPDKAITLSRTAAGVTASDAEGKLLYTSTQNADGSVTVVNAQSKTVRTFNSQTVEHERQDLVQN